MTRNAFTCASVLAAAVLLSACASGVNLKEVPVETRSPTTGTTPLVPAQGTTAPTESQVATVRTGTDTGSGVTSVDVAGATLASVGRVVYFDFDSFVVREDGRPVVDAHAKALVANRGRRIVVEGHTDERGGREYNLALGQKRALAVVKALTLLGASPSQLEAVSYGEERAAVQGSSEEAWAKNRRAELKDAK
jgi:peptidoglycan-associated lipoprotein